MATIDQLKQALINADKAGDTAAATKLAAAIRAQQTSSEPTAAPTGTEQPGLLARAGDLFTGNLRETEQTQGMPDWTEMPELNDVFSAAGWKTALGTLLSNPSETVQVIQANNPEVQVKQDEKGNYLMFSPKANTWFAIKPGFQLGDIPRAGAAIASAIPVGRIASGVSQGAGLGLKGVMAAEAAGAAATQTGIEASQAATGGEFNPEDVALAGVIGGTAPAVVQGLKATRSAISPATVANQAPIVAPAATAIAAEAPIPAKTQEEFGSLVRKAASIAPGSGKAKLEIAALAAVNPEAKAAAERMGVELPVDVISDSRMLKETTGLLRGLKGTDASTAWANKSTEVIGKARDVLASLDASPDLSTLSARVQASIRESRDGLHSSAKELYKQVDELVPTETVVNLKNTQQLLSEVLRKNPNSMTAPEKKLLELATRSDITYGDLTSLKSDIGAALRGIRKGADDYTSISDYRLNQLNEALGADKLGAVGPELAPVLKQADRFTAMQKELEKKVIGAFGKEGQGSVASSIDAAIKSGSAKGDIKQLNAVMNIIPDDMKKEAIMSGIYRNSRANDHFSFQKFSNLYSGLRENNEVYKEVAKVLSKDEQEMLRSLYVVSKRMAGAESLVSKTGASLQPLMNSINAQSLVGKVVSSTGGKVAAAAIGMKMGGPIGGAVAAGATSKIAEKSVDAGIKRASDLLTSPEFGKLVMEAAKKGDAIDKTTVRRAVMSPSFSAFAREIKLPSDINARERWVMQAIIAGNTMKEDEK